MKRMVTRRRMYPYTGRELLDLARSGKAPIETPAVKAKLKELGRAFAMMRLRLEEVHWSASGNPLFAWRLYQLARVAGEPIPESVLAYLDGVAARISGSSAAADLPGALGLETMGQGDSFARAKRHLRMIEAYFAVEERPEGTSATEAKRQFAEENGVSYRTVSGWYKEVKNRLG
jgi:hypothetical protein